MYPRSIRYIEEKYYYIQKYDKKSPKNTGCIQNCCIYPKKVEYINLQSFNIPTEKLDICKKYLIHPKTIEYIQRKSDIFKNNDLKSTKRVGYIQEMLNNVPKEN